VAPTHHNIEVNMKEQRRSNKIFLATSGLVVAALAGTASVLAQNGESGGSPGATPSASPSQSQLQTTTREVYLAQLNPANGAAANGSALIVVDGNQAGIFIQAQGLAPGVSHEQHIHLGTACATSSADTNQDGYVDAVEATVVTGPPALPLAFIPGQDGSSSYPVAAQDGTVNYIASLSLSAAKSLLSTAAAAAPAPSPSTSESAAPSPESSPGTSAQLGLEGKVIEIHGTDPNTALPATVQGIDGKSAAATLPQACGQLQRMTE
jgi:hypothetical protein